MHNLASNYDYEFSIMHKDDDEEFYHKYKDYEPTIKHFRE